MQNGHRRRTEQRCCTEQFVDLDNEQKIIHMMRFPEDSPARRRFFKLQSLPCIWYILSYNKYAKRKFLLTSSLKFKHKFTVTLPARAHSFLQRITSSVNSFRQFVLSLFYYSGFPSSQYIDLL
jgi:hypothetical protein